MPDPDFTIPSADDRPAAWDEWHLDDCELEAMEAEFEARVLAGEVIRREAA